MLVAVFSEKYCDLSCIAASFLQSFEPKINVVSVALSKVDEHPLTKALMKEACINSNKIPFQLFETIDPEAFDLLITINTSVENIELLKNIPQQIHLQFDDSALKSDEFDALRKLRDVIKNEMYIIYRDRIRK